MGGAYAHPPNRLAASRSVYLQQHARNPVDWHPWGAEAIAAARARNVPIFLSIGYSTCYWCHVMERESFEDSATAAVLNRVCVPVKVDREERPDIDEVMMTACQVFTQLTEGRASGGWPLNVFLDPQSLQPFFCGTYFPPQPAHGRPSFTQLLTAVEAAWQKDAAGLRAQAEQIAQHVRAQLSSGASDASGTHAPSGAQAAGPQPAHVQPAPEQTAREQPAPEQTAREQPAHEQSTPNQIAINSEVLEQQVVDALMSAYDPTNGGFGGAPKFPTPSYASFLFATRGHVPSIERALRHTLDRMAVGGIFDQVGGGFHRYSVDAQWTVPHFEKMLYDNAQLATLYVWAADRWGDAFYAQVARRTLDYVLREMTGAEGQFFSAQDAEVGAREGANYVWTATEFRAALKERDAPASRDAPAKRDALAARSSGHRVLAADIECAMRAYGLDRGPNFQDPHHPDAAPCCVLRLDDRPEAVANGLGMSGDEFARIMARVNAALLASRATRPQPITDDKTIASWSGMAMEALATAGRVLHEPRYTAAAERAADFVLTRMRDPRGDLLRIWRAGEAAGAGFLEDSACVANGLLALGRRADALAVVRAAHERFADARSGAWFDVAAGQNELWVRSRNLDDGAVPSGTSSMLRALVALGATDEECLRWARELVASVAATVREQPVSASGIVLGAWHMRAPASNDVPPPVSFELRWTPGTATAELLLRIATLHHVTAEGGLRVEPTPGAPSFILTPLVAPSAQGWMGDARFALAFAAVPATAPAVVVHWQVCTDRECLPLQTSMVQALT